MKTLFAFVACLSVAGALALPSAHAQSLRQDVGQAASEAMNRLNRATKSYVEGGAWVIQSLQELKQSESYQRCVNPSYWQWAATTRYHCERIHENIELIVKNWKAASDNAQIDFYSAAMATRRQLEEIGAATGDRRVKARVSQSLRLVLSIIQYVDHISHAERLAPVMIFSSWPALERPSENVIKQLDSALNELRKPVQLKSDLVASLSG